MTIRILITLFALVAGAAQAKEILTNNLHIAAAPGWLTEGRADRDAAKVANFLEWDIRRVEVRFYTDRGEFMKSHGLGPAVRAYFRGSDNSVNIGPDVNDIGFDEVFMHELSHVISFQKFKGAIPAWLEEGLANYVSGDGKVDYAWLASQPARDVTTLVHPFGGANDPRYHYQASTALAEMLAKKCGMSDLLQLSVGKKMETYLSTYCEISDINASFRDWLKVKSAGSPKVTESKTNSVQSGAPVSAPKDPTIRPKGK